MRMNNRVENSNIIRRMMGMESERLMDLDHFYTIEKREEEETDYLGSTK